MSHLLLVLTRQAARLALWLARHGNLAKLLAGMLALGLGLWGWCLKQPPLGPTDYFNTLFRTLQLATLQFPRELEAAIPWQLQLARLAVPLVAALATLNILIGSLTRPIRLALLQWERQHIIVFGAERLTQAALRALAVRDCQVVLVSTSFGATQRAELEGMGLTCVEADLRLAEAQAALNLRHAAALLLTAEEDLANLDRAMLAMAALRQRPTELPPLLLGVLLEDETLASALEATLDTRTREHHVRYHRLCPDREGLRETLGTHAPVLLKPDPAMRTHVLVVGLAGRWQQVLAQLLLATQDHPQVAPLFSLLLDETEASAFTTWCAARPELTLAAEFALLPAMPETAPEGWQVPQLAVVLQADSAGIATALALRQPDHALGTQATPILVRQQREDRVLAALGAVVPVGNGLAGLVPFGGVLRPESLDRVLDRKGDAVAMALHAHYQQVGPALGGGTAASLADWDALPENLREASRAAAAHAPVLFAAAGLRLGGGSAPLALDEARLDLLARVEHRRWCAERVEHGWRYGAVRDNSRRLHPSLRPFDALPPNEQQKDREAVLALAGVLARSGFGPAIPQAGIAPPALAEPHDSAVFQG